EGVRTVLAGSFGGRSGSGSSLIASLIESELVQDTVECPRQLLAQTLRGSSVGGGDLGPGVAPAARLRQLSLVLGQEVPHLRQNFTSRGLLARVGLGGTQLSVPVPQDVLAAIVAPLRLLFVGLFVTLWRAIVASNLSRLSGESRSY